MRCDLQAGEVLCLGAPEAPFPLPESSDSHTAVVVPRVEHQRRRATVLDLAAFWNGDRCDHLDIDALADLLAEDPLPRPTTAGE